MATKSHNIRIDEKVKTEAAAVFASLGLTLSDAVNVFLRKAVAEQGFPFEVKRNATESTEERRARKFKEFLAFAKENPVFEKGYKFNREECHDRAIFRR
ncbi:MAG: type II toxin-antitoxin system RelB/DinJ family antitoxin [Opitutaceae bacterium]|jgi:DNA-damage-inducible protein J|nr:type II toxin-antitoxin system RelB/DinJ family antitoxin [Opitutaceae bacterium]